ncbi:MAG: phosphotransferase [Anaerovoracaceae bacterium]
MASLNIEQNIEQILHSIFDDESIVYDRSRFAGGLTNYNYFIEIRGNEYIVREPGVSTELIIDRHAEQTNNDLASKLDINSECIYFDSTTGIKISRRIQFAENFANLEPGSQPCIEQAAYLMKLLHNSSSNFPNKFNWYLELEKYEQIVTSLRGALFFNYQERKEQLLNFISKNITDFSAAPCHNDTVPENFLMNTSTGKSFLIDWEYSGMNDPSWDIAMYILESKLSDDAISRLLTAYYGISEPDKKTLIKLKCMCLAQDLIWSTWGIIRHYSGEDFLEYLNMRYGRFSKNLLTLMKDIEYPLCEMVK